MDARTSAQLPPTSTHHPGARPRLLGVSVSAGLSEGPSALVRIEWCGHELSGYGDGELKPNGRHEAVAVAAADALASTLDETIRVEYLSLDALPAGGSVTVTVLGVGTERLVGVALAPDGAEEYGAARAVLHALNRRLSQRRPT